MVTIEHIVGEIWAGRCTKIYLCSKSLWWTHTEADLVKGKTPLGFKVNINSNPKKFIDQTKKAPGDWYGKHGIQAFMKAHAQNCQKHFYNKWEMYNNLIDKENGITST